MVEGLLVPEAGDLVLCELSDDVRGRGRHGDVGASRNEPRERRRVQEVVQRRRSVVRRVGHGLVYNDGLVASLLLVRPLGGIRLLIGRHRPRQYHTGI